MANSNGSADAGMPKGIDNSLGGGIQRRWGDRGIATGARGVGRKADVDTPSPAWTRMSSKWSVISTVLAGTASMREAGRTYLPAHQYETTESYEERRQRATLKNYTLRTLDNLTSKAFRDAPKLGDDVHEAVRSLTDDIDAEGSGINVFARLWFRTAVERGFAFVLVDHSRTATDTVGMRTLQDDVADDVRPFWRLIDPIDVLHIRVARIGSAVRVTEARIREFETVSDGWQDVHVERIRVLRPGSFELYEKRQSKRGSRPQWTVVDSGPMGLDYVPLVSFYTDRAGVAEGKPPLEDLAHLNVEHFQSSSDQRAILTVARFPILAVSGAANTDPNDKPVTIGPKQWLSVSDPNGRIYYVEHAGNAIAAGRTDLEDIEDQMASYGSEFLRKRPGASSATGRALDSAEAISSLMAWGLDFKDAMELALQYTADWLSLGEGAGGTVVYKISPDVSVGESKELDILDRARARQDISRVAFLSELQRRDILSAEFDAEGDMALIASEPPPPSAANFQATISGGQSRDSMMAQKRGPERTTGNPPVLTE